MKILYLYTYILLRKIIYLAQIIHSLKIVELLYLLPLLLAGIELYIFYSKHNIKAS